MKTSPTPQQDLPVVDSPDHELVRAVLDGDATAYKGLVERYQGRIYNVIYGMVRNREDARDLTQDAFVKAYKNLSRFRFGSSFYTWICRIGMNVAIDHLRKQKVRKAQEFDDGVATKGQGRHQHRPCGRPAPRACEAASMRASSKSPTSSPSSSARSSSSERWRGWPTRRSPR